MPFPLSSPEQQLDGIPLSLDPLLMQRHIPLPVCPEQQLSLSPGLPFGTHAHWPLPFAYPVQQFDGEPLSGVPFGAHWHFLSFE